MQIIKVLTKLHTSVPYYEYIFLATLVFTGWLAAEFKNDFWPEIQTTYYYITDTLSYYTGITFDDIMDLYNLANHMFTIVYGITIVVISTYILSIVLSNKCKYICDILHLSASCSSPSFSIYARTTCKDSAYTGCVTNMLIIFFIAFIAIFGFSLIGDGIAGVADLDTTFSNIPINTHLNVINPYFISYATSFPYIL